MKEVEKAVDLEPNNQQTKEFHELLKSKREEFEKIQRLNLKEEIYTSNLKVELKRPRREEKHQMIFREQGKKD